MSLHPAEGLAEWVLRCRQEKRDGTRVLAHTSDGELTTTGAQHCPGSFWERKGGSFKALPSLPTVCSKSPDKLVSNP